MLSASETRGNRAHCPAHPGFAFAQRRATTVLRLEQRRPLAQRFARGRVARKESLHHRPEPLRVVEFDEVRDLVRDHVIGKLGRKLHQPPIETDLAPVIETR